MITDAQGNPAPRFKPPSRPECAGLHKDPPQWKSAGFDDRGHEKLICKTCKRFIGYRPPESAKEQSKRATGKLDND